MTRKWGSVRLRAMRLTILCLLASALFPSLSRAQAPVFEITPVESSVKFDVEASVAIKGTFDKWDATLTFTSPDVSTGVLDIKIQAASVDTGSGMKNGKLKGKDFFDVDHSPLITFHSTKIVQTGPNTFEVDGDFTIRGVTKPEKLTLTLSRCRGPAQAQSTGQWPSTVRIWDEQRDSVHQDRQPRRGECLPQRKASQRASVGPQKVVSPLSGTLACPCLRGSRQLRSHQGQV